MKKRIKRIAIDTLGWLFVVMGLLGLILPFLQGILFLIMGIYILSLHSKFAHRELHKLKLRYPKIGGRIDSFDHRLRKFLGIENI